MITARNQHYQVYEADIGTILLVYIQQLFFILEKPIPL